MVDNIQFLRDQLIGLQKKYKQIEKTNEKLNDKLLELYSLYKISLTLSTTFNLQHILKSIRDIFKSNFVVDHYSLMLFDENFEKLTMKSSFGLPTELEKIENFFIKESLFYKVITEARPVYRRNLARIQNVHIYPNYKEPGGSFITIPLMPDENQSIGLLNLYRQETNGFSRHELNLLKRISTQIAKVIDKTLLFSQTRELSITDELTGIYNRRYFNQRFEREILRAKRYKRKLSVVMLDIDHFKTYNDTHGHLMGDEVLVKFTQIIDSIVRKADILARYGGEEFVILLPEIDKNRAIQAAEKFRKAIEKNHFTGEENQPGGSLTLSLGTATYPEDATDAKSLLALADKALYTAKRRSRNAVGFVLNANDKTFDVYKNQNETLNSSVINPTEAINMNIAV